jgi:hypothetical protein
VAGTDCCRYAAREARPSPGHRRGSRVPGRLGDATTIALGLGVPEWLLAALRQTADRFPLDEPLQAKPVLALAAA